MVVEKGHRLQPELVTLRLQCGAEGSRENRFNMRGSKSCPKDGS